MKNITAGMWLLCMALLPVASGAADSERSFPVRPIRMVVPFPPGAASDFLARVVGQRLGELYGQQVIIDNRPGGGGVVGSVIVARSAPDGYTLSMIGTPHVVNPLLTDKALYRPLDEFTPITQVASLPNILITGIPVQSVQELIALAKQKPGQLNFASAGIGSLSYMAGELFKQAAGIDVQNVSFKMLGDAVTEMVAGRVHFYVIPVAAGMPLIRDGKLRVLAVTIDKRLESLPNVPTMAEAGLPNYRFDGWFGVAGPAKMPLQLVATLNRDIIGVVQQPDTRDRFVRQGAEPVFGTPAEFEKLMRSEFARFAKVVKESGIRAQ
jgi:tripartite-type tricarboxylate transporter receptor subunit TctC